MLLKISGGIVILSILSLITLFLLYPSHSPYSLYVLLALMCGYLPLAITCVWRQFLRVPYPLLFLLFAAWAILVFKDIEAQGVNVWEILGHLSAGVALVLVGLWKKTHGP